jgi:hypothetical protein
MKEKTNKPMKTKKTLTKRRKTRKLKPKSVAAPVFNKGDSVVVVDERALRNNFGKKAKVVSVTSAMAVLDFSPDGGVTSIPLDYLKADKFEQFKPMRSMSNLSPEKKVEILKDMDCHGDGGDKVEISDRSGKLLLHQSLVAGWSYMKMFIESKPGKLQEYIYVYIYMCIYMYMYTCIYVYIHIYIYTHVYTRTHMHTYAFIDARIRIHNVYI